MSANLLTFEQWKQSNAAGETPEQGLSHCNMLDVLNYGRLIIATGRSTLRLAQFHVDTSGECTTAALLDMADPTHYTPDAYLPEGPTMGHFFQTDEAHCGESFSMMLYDPRERRSVAAYLPEVKDVHIEPYLPDQEVDFPDPGYPQQDVIARFRLMRHLDQVWPAQVAQEA